MPRASKKEETKIRKVEQSEFIVQECKQLYNAIYNNNYIEE